jgi:UDP-N-acetylmuramoyl-L-alanyl-D-glutamate--2,6-diaminopimelate ligase
LLNFTVKFTPIQQKMLLKNILDHISILQAKGGSEVAIEHIELDSRKVGAKGLFVAIKGSQNDGHQYISQVVAQGAAAVICEQLPAELATGVSYIQVADSALALGLAAANFYGNPSHKLKLIGVTGTNGKTTNVTVLFNLFRALGYRCGLISTVQNQINHLVIPSTHTTPEPITLNKLLAQMLADGCTHVFMEVSSHAVVQQRIAGLKFTGGVFTNITHDHLDFHQTFDAYIAAKKGFFDALPATAWALVNTDDRRGKIMVQNTKAQIHTFALEIMADFKGKILSDSLFGLHLQINSYEAHFMLIGAFNAYNLTGIYGAAVLLGEDPAEVLTCLSGLQTAPGRFQQILGPGQRVAIIDYAHTPDALQNVLHTIQGLREGQSKITTVVGCGGNRDTTKRPLMAEIACRLSDHVYLTSDNPRHEDPLAILEQMRQGVPHLHHRRTSILPDRHQAIAEAIATSAPGDIILIAGKGHENYQEIQGVKHHFDDVEEALTAFKLLDNNKAS